METLSHLISFMNIEDYINPVVGGFGVVIGTVYLLGRMLNLVQSPYTKNFIAVIVAFAWTIANEYKLLSDSVFSVIMIVSWLFVIYVLVGFNLYPWFNHLVETKLLKKRNSTHHHHPKTPLKKITPRKRIPKK